MVTLLDSVEGAFAPTPSAWRYLLSVSVSNEFWLRDLLGSTPLFQQALSALGIAVIFQLHPGEAIYPKVAKALPQFAPGDYDADLIEKAQRKRPDHTLRQRAAGVAIADGELAFGADGLAHEAEINAAIDAAIAETGANSPADMGKLMGVLKPKLAGQADMGLVSKLIKARLAG